MVVELEVQLVVAGVAGLDVQGALAEAVCLAAVAAMPPPLMHLLMDMVSSRILTTPAARVASWKRDFLRMSTRKGWTLLCVRSSPTTPRNVV